MPTYRVIAKNAQGEPQETTVIAATDKGALHKARQEGLFPSEAHQTSSEPELTAQQSKEENQALQIAEWALIVAKHGPSDTAELEGRDFDNRLILRCVLIAAALLVPISGIGVGALSVHDKIARRWGADSCIRSLAFGVGLTCFLVLACVIPSYIMFASRDLLDMLRRERFEKGSFVGFLGMTLLLVVLAVVAILPRPLVDHPHRYMIAFLLFLGASFGAQVAGLCWVGLKNSTDMTAVSKAIDEWRARGDFKSSATVGVKDSG